MMTLDLALLPAAEPDIAVTRVRTEADLRDRTTAYAAGHGHPPAVEAPWYAVLASLGTADDARLRHFVAYADGQPIVSASVHCADGIAGLYCVATAPAVRGSGFGSAASVAALADARGRGYSYGRPWRRGSSRWPLPPPWLPAARHDDGLDDVAERRTTVPPRQAVREA